jgi:hypothetical protein
LNPQSPLRRKRITRASSARRIADNYAAFHQLVAAAIATQPGRRRQTCRPVLTRAPFEEMFLLRKMFAAFHDPDRVETARLRLPSIRIFYFEADLIASRPRVLARLAAIATCTWLIVMPVTRHAKRSASHIAEPPIPQPMSSTLAPRGIPARCARSVESAPVRQERVTIC